MDLEMLLLFLGVFKSLLYLNYCTSSIPSVVCFSSVCVSVCVCVRMQK